MRELDPITFLVAEALFRNPCPESGGPARVSAPRRAIDNNGDSPEGICLVLLAHGSKDPRWCVPFERIAAAVQGQSGGTQVRLAYMEFVEPTLMDVARECVGQQILHLRILPLFLSIGAHLAIDIPEQVNQAKAQFPQLEVEVLSPVGEDPRLTGLIQQIVIETLNH